MTFEQDSYGKNFLLYSSALRPTVRFAALHNMVAVLPKSIHNNKKIFFEHQESFFLKNTESAVLHINCYCNYIHSILFVRSKFPATYNVCHLYGKGFKTESEMIILRWTDSFSYVLCMYTNLTSVDSIAGVDLNTLKHYEIVYPIELESTQAYTKHYQVWNSIFTSLVSKVTCLKTRLVTGESHNSFVILFKSLIG